MKVQIHLSNLPYELLEKACMEIKAKLAAEKQKGA